MNAPRPVSGAPDILEVPAPALSEVEAAALARDRYGIAGSVRLLVSERDQNFHLRVDDRREFVLKIANPAEDPEALEFQNEALEHIARVDPSLPVPRLCAGLDARKVQAVEHRGRRHLVRLLTFVGGDPISSAPGSGALRRDIGAMLARLGRALRGLFHPAAGRVLLWDLKHAPALRRYVDRIDDAGRRDLAGRALDRFETHVLPVLPSLRAQVIHNDFNPENLLLRAVDDPRITGVIDFGDLVHAPLVADLAIAVAYQFFDQHESLAAACDVVAGYDSVVPLEEGELAVLMDLVATRLAMSGIIAGWRVSEHPQNRSYILVHESFTWPALEAVCAFDRARTCEAFAVACGSRATPPRTDAHYADMPSASLRERRAKALSPGLRLSYDEPLHVVSGDGVWLYDSQGGKFLDAYNNVPHVGHCHPRVTEEIARQTRRLNTNTRYLHEHIVRYAERLAATLPGALGTCLFVCTGSEANDLAWRIAHAVTGADGAVVTDNAYHGNTNALVHLSPEELRGDERADWVATVPAPNSYSGPHRADDPGLVDRYVGYVDRAIEALQGRGHALGALFFDSIFTSDGILFPPDGYLASLFERVRSAGGLCVADEVQAGFGRTGEHPWCFQRQAVVPDIVTLGKPMGNGHPIGAVITTPEIAREFTRREHYFNTYGGNPVSCAAGLAVLDVLEQEGLQESARLVGQHLRTSLASLQEQYPLIGDVRGRGLFIGIELVRDRTGRMPASDEATDILNAMRRRGVLIGRTGLHGHVLKIRPPMVFSRANADQLVETLDDVLRARQ